MTNEMAEHELRKTHLLGGDWGWGSRHRFSFWVPNIYSNCLAIKKNRTKKNILLFFTSLAIETKVVIKEK